MIFYSRLQSFTKAYNKSMTPEDLKLMASSVLLATLSILPYDRQDRHQDETQVEQEKERIMRMANILGFAVVSRIGAQDGTTRGSRGDKRGPR